MTDEHSELYAFALFVSASFGWRFEMFLADWLNTELFCKSKGLE